MTNAIELPKEPKKISTLLLNENNLEINTKTFIEEISDGIYSNKEIKRILNVLENIDIYEDKKSSHCLPDYKFPKIRWDENKKPENLSTMTDKEIKNKFQLLTKEITQIKIKICEECYQTGKRGIAFDIPYFYKGNENWDNSIPKKGKMAELGCEGCAWYDFAEWRKNLLKILK